MTTTKTNMPLKQKIIDTILSDGPISIHRYMTIALADSQHGYYRVADPLGAKGDFTTAPEISQIFGELIGAWVLTLWDMNKQPKPFQLIEIGPGRGTLMSDVLRTTKLMPTFFPSTQLHFVETSPVLREKQKTAIQPYPIKPHWYDSLNDVPSGNTILLANEFLDALPVQHFIKQATGWHKRLITVAKDNAFYFTTDKTPSPLPQGMPPNPERYNLGDIYEYRPAHKDFIQQLAKRANTAPMAALIIDYGHTVSAPGETFQAIKSHKYTDPLKDPGHADLTAHVDFDDLARCAEAHGLKTYHITQGQFLMALGLAQRCEQLLKNANTDQARMITTGAQRLVDPNQMGKLFKVMVITNQDFPVPPPFNS